MAKNTQDKPIIIIPARMASTRLPGKPMLDIGGVPMIVQVWRRAMESKVGRVVVACDGNEIADAITKAGGEAVITKVDHPSGSDRIFEALGKVDPKGQHDIIINLQGDMPTIDPKMIAEVAAAMEDERVHIATLAAPIMRSREIQDSAVVKPVIAFGENKFRGRALYFSRQILPWGEGEYYHHIGIYAYRRAALKRFVSLPPSPLEKRERLEQLRALEYGMRIEVVIVDTVPLGVDTPEHLDEARRKL